MFEDALMESGGKISTRRGWSSGVAAVCNGSIACILVLLPLLHPASLPKQTLSTPLAAPAPPAQPPVVRVVSAASRTTILADAFTAPRHIPDLIATVDHEPPLLTGSDIYLQTGEGDDLLNGLRDSIGNAPQPQVHVIPFKKPVISSGVMEGRRVSGAEPRYTAIAIAARIQGIVVLAATISRAGAIENLRVVSGPPMLAPAAMAAVQTWRYRPYLLNGEPVEVETTIHVNFNLGG